MRSSRGIDDALKRKSRDQPGANSASTDVSRSLRAAIFFAAVVTHWSQIKAGPKGLPSSAACSRPPPNVHSQAEVLLAAEPRAPVKLPTLVTCSQVAVARHRMPIGVTVALVAQFEVGRTGYLIQPLPTLLALSVLLIHRQTFFLMTTIEEETRKRRHKRQETGYRWPISVQLVHRNGACWCTQTVHV